MITLKKHDISLQMERQAKIPPVFSLALVNPPQIHPRTIQGMAGVSAPAMPCVCNLSAIAPAVC